MNAHMESMDGAGTPKGPCGAKHTTGTVVAVVMVAKIAPHELEGVMQGQIWPNMIW